MDNKTNFPQTPLYVSSRYVCFRFDRIPSRQFYRYLHFVKRQFPYMRWNRSIHMWQLPIHDLKPLYELCRLLFGVNNVQFQYRQYSNKSRFMQRSLFKSREA